MLAPVIVHIRTLVRKVVFFTVTTTNVRALPNHMSLFLTVTTLDRFGTVVSKVAALSTSRALETVAISNQVTALTTVLTDLGGTVLINMSTIAATTAADLRTLENLMSFLLAIVTDQRPRFLGTGATRFGGVSRTATLRFIGRVGLLCRRRHNSWI